MLAGAGAVQGVASVSTEAADHNGNCHHDDEQHYVFEAPRGTRYRLCRGTSKIEFNGKPFSIGCTCHKVLNPEETLREARA